MSLHIEIRCDIRRPRAGIICESIHGANVTARTPSEEIRNARDRNWLANGLMRDGIHDVQAICPGCRTDL